MSTIESDDEAPESVSFGSSKQRAREDENALQNFRTQEKRNKKEKNRERDRKFKERAVQSGKSGKAKSEEEQPAGSDGDEEDAGPSRSDLEERMARAMKEADEESASGSESESDEGLLRSKKGVERDGSGDSSQDESEDVGSDSEASNLSEEEEEEDEHPKSSKYLPDHIFASAFSEPTLPNPTSKRKQLGEDGPRKAKKRRTKKSSKDVVVG